MRKRLHRSVTNRKLLNEYVVLASVFIVLWSLSVLHFRSDLNMYNSIRSNRLEDPIKDFEYEQVIDTKTSDIRSITLAVKTTPPQAGTFIPVRVEKGDTNRSIVHKAVDQVLASRTDIVVPYKDRAEIEAHTLASLRQSGVYISPASVALIEISQIENSIYTTLSSTKSLGG